MTGRKFDLICVYRECGKHFGVCGVGVNGKGYDEGKIVFVSISLSQKQ